MPSYFGFISRDICHFLKQIDVQWFGGICWVSSLEKSRWILVKNATSNSSDLHVCTQVSFMRDALWTRYGFSLYFFRLAELQSRMCTFTLFFVTLISTYWIVVMIQQAIENRTVFAVTNQTRRVGRSQLVFFFFFFFEPWVEPGYSVASIWRKATLGWGMTANRTNKVYPEHPYQNSVCSEQLWSIFPIKSWIVQDVPRGSGVSACHTVHVQIRT